MSNGQTEVRTAKFKVYRSKHNGHIRGAMTNSPGYEDEHPEDWEGYNSLDEARMSQAKLDQVVEDAIAAQAASQPQQVQLPGSIQLAPDDLADLVAVQAANAAAAAPVPSAQAIPLVTMPPPPPIPTVRVDE